MLHTYREQIPGLPNLHTGEGYKDPLAITLENVKRHLVGWMTVDQLAASMCIQTRQAKDVLRSFLRENRFTATYEAGEELWSNFDSTRSKQ
jgi:hypothetical protein